MPHRPSCEPDDLLARVLRLAERDIRAMETRERIRRKARMATGVEPEGEQIKLLVADRESLIKMGEWLRKVSLDTTEPDLSKLSDAEIERLSRKLGGSNG